MGLIIHVDGGARGNPGPAGAGVVIQDEDGQRLYEASYFLGRQTNNAAEYHALIRALDRVQQFGAQSVTIFSDSELMVRQLTGEYRVKSPLLAPLFRQAQMLLLKVPRWTVRHVLREENKRADELANLAMDAGKDQVVFDAEGQVDEPIESLGEVVTPAQPAAATPPPQPVAEHPVHPMRKAVRVRVSRAPKPGACPAGGFSEQTFTVENTLPAGLCVRAAHALLPTLLAMLNTDPQEFAAIPTLTVCCSHPGCGATFQLSPVRSTNGVPRRRD